MQLEGRSKERPIDPRCGSIAADPSDRDLEEPPPARLYYVEAQRVVIELGHDRHSPPGCPLGLMRLRELQEGRELETRGVTDPLHDGGLARDRAPVREGRLTRGGRHARDGEEHENDAGSAHV
jgi:hypothetical protein